MKLTTRYLLAFALCAFIPCIALADDDDQREDEDTVEIYGMELPRTRPQTAGNISDDEKEKYEKLREARAKVMDCYDELAEISKLGDPKKVKRKAQGALRKLDRLKKAYYKEAKKARGKVDKPYKQLKNRIDSLEKQLRRAEDKNDTEKAAKISRELKRITPKFEALENIVVYVNYNSFFTEEDDTIAAALEMEIPGQIKPKANADDDDDDQKADKQKKKKKKRGDDDDDDDDDDKPRKKKKRRNRR